MNDFLPVCKVGDIPDPGKQIVEVGDRYVVLFHVDGRFYALDDVCTHDGGPLGEGLLEGYTIASAARRQVRHSRRPRALHAGHKRNACARGQGGRRRGLRENCRPGEEEICLGMNAMPIQEETVYSALKQVRDPELMINVVDLGLIYGIALEDAGEKTNLGVMMTMTTPACPYGPQLVADVREALTTLAGAGEVKVEVTLTPPWSPDMMTEAARDELGMF